MKRRGNAEALVIIAALLSAALLLGCGAAGDDRKLQQLLSGTTTPAATVVGMKTCTQCHYSSASAWLRTSHANLDPSDPSNLSYVGDPATGSVLPGVCKSCHDLDTDSANLISSVTGNVARPVVGCEACHGGGSNHNGAGPIGVPYRLATSSSTPPTTGLTTLTVAQAANTLATISRAAGDFTTDGFAAGQIITTSGFTTAKNNGTFAIVTVVPLTITVNSTGMAPEAVGTGDELIVAQTLTASSQINTCNACHELLNMTTGAANPTSAHDGTAPINTNNVIRDTHFAKPGNYNCMTTGFTITGQSVNCSNINGYAMDYSSDQACSNCHALHADTISINREWAASAHADKSALGTTNGFFSGAWAHYNWTASASRRPCQRCHTTTVFAAYADALRSGNTALASAIDAGTSSFLATDANYKPQMLHCNGCHTDNRGTVRNPGAITANYSFVSSGVQYSIASFAYPDVANSNVCMACHTARESGDSLKNINTGQPGTSTFAFDNQSFINSHYLTGGGTVFTATGFEFNGRTYANANSFKHDKIGTAASSPPTGVNGPCIGCHMSRPGKNGNHLFLPIVRDQAFTPPVTTPDQAGTGISGVASEVCITCHTDSGAGGLVERIWERKVEYFEALEALNAQLVIRDFNFVPASPYFFIDIAANYDPAYVEIGACNTNLPVKNWQTGGSSLFTWNATTKRCDSTVNAAGTAGTGKLNMGAAFNFNLLEHEPGAYIHNNRYARRLIYDSIDWLDDNIMNYSVGNTLDTLCPGPAYCPGAIKYLLVGEALPSQPFLATERP